MSWADEQSPAGMLASWTKLKPDEFAPLYQRIDAAAAGEHWSLLALEGNAILKACEEAARLGFIRELARRVADAESRTGRNPGEIDAMLFVLGNPAITQGIVDPSMGFPGRSILRALDKATLACTKITAGGRPVGTGFLVGPDLVLTAGHVVLETAEQGGTTIFGSRLRKDLRFFFARDGETYDQEVEPATRRDGGPEVMARPYATPPDLLERRLCSKTAEALDFALVRLARQVTNIAYLDIEKPPSPRTEAVWVVGFPRGGPVVLPNARIETFDTLSARIFHKANTDQGMSGGCCIGPDGTPVGLHEGTLALLDENSQPRFEDGKVLVINRAVALTAIRARLAAEKMDPLSRRPHASGLAFLDRPTLARWRAEARRLAGGSLDAWDKAVQRRLGISPTEPELPAYHPWFARPKLETWIDDAPSKPLERVRYINGPPGAGKSFAARIVAGKIPEPARDLVILDATVVTKWDWEDALTRLAGTTRGEVFRTGAGELRHEMLPAIVGRLGKIDGETRRPDQPLYIAIDFERDTAGSSLLRFENTPWPPFIVALAGQPWARLLLIGLSEAERTDFDDMFHNDFLAAKVNPEDIDFDHVGREGIIDFLKDAFKAQGDRVSRDALNTIVTDWNNPEFYHDVPEMQTVEAVLFAMERARALWDPSAQPAAGQGQ